MPPDLGMLAFGARAWMLAVLLLALGWSVHAHAPGFQVVGELSATPTEHAEQMVAIGSSVVLIVRDKAIFERQIAPLISRDVELTLVGK